MNEQLKFIFILQKTGFRKAFLVKEFHINHGYLPAFLGLQTRRLENTISKVMTDRAI
jgi:hypothetical protein